MAVSSKTLSAHGALWAVLALALALRLAAGAWFQSRLGAGQRFEFGDSDAYWVLGQQLAQGKPFQYGSPDLRVFRMPGYPALLAAMFRLFGDDMPVTYARWLSAALGTAAVAAVYWLAATLFDRRTALVAALVAACYPGAIALSAVVLSEAPFCPLYLAQLAAWVKSWQAADERRSFAWAAASGIFGGLAALMRPDWLLFVPFATAVAMLGSVLVGAPFVSARRGAAGGSQHWRHLKLGLVMSLAIAAVMTPWWWRNARLTGHFVPTTLQVGASLYDGLNPQADGSSEMSFVLEFFGQERRRPSLPRESFEYRLDRRLWDAAWRWAAGHPARVAELAATKFARLWNIWPNDPRNRGGLVRLLSVATYVPAIALALAGVWCTRRRGWPAAVVWLPAVYVTLLHLVFVSSIRYREPPMLGLLVFTAAAMTQGSRPSSAP